MSIDLNIYCDESCYCNLDDSYFVIGSIACLRLEKRQIVRQLNGIKHRYDIGGEFGWKSVSENKEGFYRAVLDWFAGCDDLSFRCAVVNKANPVFMNSEDAFYIAYRQLLQQWFEPEHAYHVYLDRKKNSKQKRVELMRGDVQSHMAIGCNLACMEEVDSRECSLVQMADLLIGCIGYEWNGRINASALSKVSAFKSSLCGYLARLLGISTLRISTPQSKSKFKIYLLGE